MKESYNSLKAPKAVGHYPHAKQVGEFVFLSGVGPRKRGSKDIPALRWIKTEKLKAIVLKHNVYLFLKMLKLF